MAAATALATIPAGSRDLSLEMLQCVFGADLIDWEPPPTARKMDYSGALICRVGLRWAAAAAAAPPAAAAEGAPSAALVKFVDPADSLAGVSEAKVTRTLRSYEAEVAVLRDLCPLLAAAGVRVPAVHAVEAEREPFRSLVVMECCTPEFAQHALLDRGLAIAALDWLARFHALGYAVRAQGTLAESKLWPKGGHTSLENRPAAEVDQVAEGFERLRQNFAEAGPEFIQPSADLGLRLQRVARRVDQWIAESDWQTLSHGDFKAGNLFLKHTAGAAGEDTGAAADEGVEVCVIDWQWTGWNISQHDLIYFLSTSVDDECTEDYRELLRIYHERFVANLSAEQPDKGQVGVAAAAAAGPAAAAAAWPFEESMRLFRLAVLDYMRWAFAYRLVDET
jgi:hypothetical protein